MTEDYAQALRIPSTIEFLHTFFFRLWLRSVFFHFQESKGKGKGRPGRDHEYPEREQRYSFTLSLTSALYGVRG
jgi:hypothetical protein